MKQTLYTMGYGLLKGAYTERKLAFQNRLRRIQCEIGKPLTVVDIREKGSGSRNGPSFRQGGDIHEICMCSTVRHSYDGEEWFVYYTEPCLSNIWGGAKWQLQMYACDLVDAINDGPDADEMLEAFTRVRVEALKGERAVVLLCGCRDVFKPNGHTWNCHRGPLAEALKAELGPEWTVKHL